MLRPGPRRLKLEESDSRIRDSICVLSGAAGQAPRPRICVRNPRLRVRRLGIHLTLAYSRARVRCGAARGPSGRRTGA